MKQAPLFGNFCYLFACYLFSTPFGCAYDAQYNQGQESCKRVCAQQLADVCGYLCTGVVHTLASHKDYITTLLSALNRVQWDTEIDVM